LKKKNSPVPIFTKKENATFKQRIEILDWHRANKKTQHETAEHFTPIYPNLQIKQPLISSWVKNEHKWRETASCSMEQTAKCARQTQHPKVTEMMDLWVLEAMSNNILLTGEVLRQKWTTFANLVGIPEEDRLKLSDGWLARFKARHGLKEFKHHGEAASASVESAETEQQ
jgi:hypothetical protein